MPQLPATYDQSLELLSRSAGLAECELERSLARGAEGEDPPDMRDLNAAITALRRLIDARKAIHELQEHERALTPEQHRKAIDDEICRAFGDLEPLGEE